MMGCTFLLRAEAAIVVVVLGFSAGSDGATALVAGGPGSVATGVSSAAAGALAGTPIPDSMAFIESVAADDSTCWTKHFLQYPRKPNIDK